MRPHPLHPQVVRLCCKGNIAPLETEILPPHLVSHEIAPTTLKIAPEGRFRPRQRPLDSSVSTVVAFCRKVLPVDKYFSQDAATCRGL